MRDKHPNCVDFSAVANIYITGWHIFFSWQI